MGILRFYLALCVVASHGGPVFPWQMHNGSQAVQIFYMISGFYMAMVLSTRYSTRRDFYVSRCLRIFPPYWIVLTAIVVISLCSGLLSHQWLALRYYVSHPFRRNGVSSVLLAAISNITLIGQDWIMFLKQDRGQSLQFTANFWDDRTPLWHYLLLQQTWTLGVELTFYACAPFLNRLRSSSLVCIAAATLAGRLIGYRYLGIGHDPWTYRFFPFELGLFLFGMLGYRIYARVIRSDKLRGWQCLSWPVYLFGAIAILLLLYVHIFAVNVLGRIINPQVAEVATYPFFILVIPCLFLVFGKNPFDRLMGELSYPIYLVYDFVIVIVARSPALDVGVNQGRMDAMVSILVAIFIYRLVIEPIDGKRHALSRDKSV